MKENTQISDLIIYSDRQYVICNKPAGLPVQKDKTEDEFLKATVEQYIKQKLFICNRIDRPVSGLVVFAKKSNGQSDFNSQISKNEVDKSYIAIVEKKEASFPPQGTLTHYLEQDPIRKKTTCHDSKTAKSKKAVLHYTLLKELDNYFIIVVKTETGRFHQIRAQLAHFGHPIKGDVKYGARRKNPDRTIHLHAWKIAFKHVTQANQLAVQAPIPDHDNLWKEVEVES